MNEIDRYFELMNERPEQFVNEGPIKVVKDRSIIERYADQTGCKLGVIYESPYNILVADLVDDGKRTFRYERLIPSNRNNSVVAIPFKDGRFVLIKQFRHALRGYQICFPRGFSEPNLTSSENVVKEVREEIGADVLNTEFLGTICADSGISGECTDVFLCRIDDFKITEGYEGIFGTETATLFELENMIRSGMIDDSFTIVSYALLKTKKNVDVLRHTT